MAVILILIEDTSEGAKQVKGMKYIKFLAWIGTGIGAIGGYLYWKEIGCITGTCPLKSQWQTMIPIGAYFGFVAGDVLKGFFYATKKDQDKQ